jgi:hypothetical protein
MKISKFNFFFFIIFFIKGISSNTFRRKKNIEIASRKFRKKIKRILTYLETIYSIVVGV